MVNNITKKSTYYLSVSIWLLALLSVYRVSAQSGSFGNSFVHSGSETAIHSAGHTFGVGGGVPLDGIVGTERVSPRGYLSFVGTSSWVGASHSAHVDGYVRSYLGEPFTFPIGDNGLYRPIRVGSASREFPIDAAYYRANPSIAITTSLKGGNEPVLPNSTYSTMLKLDNIQNVSTSEYWDVNGALSSSLTLTWDENSNISSITSGALDKLTIVGWNGTQWVAIPSMIDVSSIIGGASTMTSGSITTTAPIILNNFDVYTFAALDKGKVISTRPDIAVGNVNSLIAGNVSTNDNVLSGTTYGTPVALVGNPSGAVPVMNANGSFTFISNVPGVYVFAIPVCSPGQTINCSTELLTITVLDPESKNNKPIVNTDYPITSPNTPIVVRVLSNDASGNAGYPLVNTSLSLASSPKNGTAVVNADGTITYTPRSGFLGYDTFTYTICDSMQPPNCATASVIVFVSNSVSPDVQDDIAVGPGILTGNSLSNDRFPIGSNPYVKPQDIIIEGKGRFVVDSAGNYIWQPNPGFTGSVQIVITTCDRNLPGACYSSTIHIASTYKTNSYLIPNYFSPNGDGVNDVWNLDDLLVKYPNAKVLIYNRWGNIVWRSSGPYGKSTASSNTWYGQLEGSQDLVPDGVYYYLLELEDEFKTTKTGFIEVMRQ